MDLNQLQKVVYVFMILRGLAVAFRCPTEYIDVTHKADYFTSPGFPMGYPNGMDCQWILRAPKGEQIEIIFSDVLTESCCDIVELRDGNSSSAGLLASYRGNVTDSIYVSSFGSLFVQFRTDESYVDYGFWAEFRIATTKSKNCTEQLEATTNKTMLYSPGWPNDYQSNLLCKWTITAPPGKSVFVEFEEMDTETCCDYVLIRYGSTMKSHINTLGGPVAPNIRPNYTSPGTSLQIVFRSDSTFSRRGFKASFRAVSREIKKPEQKLPECGGKIPVPQHGHGTFTTPQYPSKHANNLTCTWVLVAPPKDKVMLWFTSISTEACCDFIKIRDGESSTSWKLGVLSGQIMFISFVSTTNKLRIDFESDITTASRGFRAVFERLHDSTKESCGGVLRATKTRRRYFSSPNWPFSPVAIECRWTLYAPAGYSVLFQVIGFHTHRFRDQILFYDGNTENLFATMDGKSTRVRYISSSNALVVVFKSDVTTTEGGFRAFYKAVPKRDTALGASTKNKL